MRKYGGSRACGMCGNGGAAGLLQGCPLREVPFARADDCIGPPSGLGGAAVSAASPVPGRNVGRATSPAAWEPAPPQGFRDDASIVPYGCGGKALPGF